MNQRRRPQLNDHQRLSYARQALTRPKRVAASAADIVIASDASNGVHYPSDSQDEPWRVRFYRNQQMLRAQLFAVGTNVPLIALDHHSGRAQDMFGDVLPPGYHWDVYWPFKSESVIKARIRIDNQMPYSYDAVILVACLWNLELQPDIQLRLP